MKGTIFVALMLLVWSSGSFSDEESKNVCLYEGKQYTRGSIVEMAGEKKVCRDSAYELSKLQKDNPDNYYSPSFFVNLEWRHIINDKIK